MKAAYGERIAKYFEMGVILGESCRFGNVVLMAFRPGRKTRGAPGRKTQIDARLIAGSEVAFLGASKIAAVVGIEIDGPEGAVRLKVRRRVGQGVLAA